MQQIIRTMLFNVYDLDDDDEILDILDIWYDPLYRTLKYKSVLYGGICMSRKMKLSVDERLKFVERYLNNESSMNQLAIEAYVSMSTMKNWITLYENERKGYKCMSKIGRMCINYFIISSL